MCQQPIHPQPYLRQRGASLQGSEGLLYPSAAVAGSPEALSALYQFRILTEEDWIAFKLLFDRIFPGFICRLRECFPTLTPGDERQVLFIRLNIGNWECASMLGITPESVKKNRYRLRKKFEMPEHEQLDEFVKRMA